MISTDKTQACLRSRRSARVRQLITFGQHTFRVRFSGREHVVDDASQLMSSCGYGLRCAQPGFTRSPYCATRGASSSVRRAPATTLSPAASAGSAISRPNPFPLPVINQTFAIAISSSA
jgi:hypothetical protein